MPFDNAVRFDDGGAVGLQRRERPHLIFDERGYISHLTNGVQPPPDPEHGRPPTDLQGRPFLNDFTYTLVVPVAEQKVVPRDG